MKNWKTSLSGLLAIVPVILHALFPEVVTTEVAASITTVFVALGLMASKDHNVTGGNIQQEPKKD